MPSASRVRWAKFRVFVVALAAVAIFGTMAYLLVGGLLLQPRARIFLYIPDATGLSEGSPVRVDGIDVGKVDSVALSGSKVPNRVVKVTMILGRDRLRAIPVDSIAQISSDSIVGDKYVDVSSGKSTRGLAAGGEMIYQDQPELLKTLDLTQFAAQLRVIDATLRDIQEGRNQFGQFMQGDSFYRDLIRRMTELRRGLHAAISTTGTIGGLMGSDRLHQQMIDFLSGLDASLAQIQSGQGQAGQLFQNTAPYDRLLQSVRDFRRTVGQFRGSALMQSDDAYDGLSHGLAAFVARVDQANANPMLTTTSQYENLDGGLRELRDTIRDFRANPKKYMRVKVF